MDHIGLTTKFILTPSQSLESKGTGGSKLTEFLAELANNTKKYLL